MLLNPLAMKLVLFCFFILVLLRPTGNSQQLDKKTSSVAKNIITFEKLLFEMTDRDRTAQFPDPSFQSLQASSYNRESVSPTQPGWFADSDGIGYIREEKNRERTEYVIMEHSGPGCITRMWTPFFYYEFNNRKGPMVRIYVDGHRSPVFEENFIDFLTGKGTVAPPFASFTARAGVCFLPIPFGKSCKITLDDKPFYNIINYRAYSNETDVETFNTAQYRNAAERIATTGEMLGHPKAKETGWQKSFEQTIGPGDSLTIHLPAGSHAVRYLMVRVGPDNGTKVLRSTVLKMNFDGEPTVWCPVGDFFCSADTLNPFKTWNRQVSLGGEMECFWVMPYFSSAKMDLLNLQDCNVQVEIELHVGDWQWDERSMYFHTTWNSFGPLPGDYFFDLNFTDIKGRGVIIGDALTVLSPGKGWWGEGDEKIYIDQEDLIRQFPSHFGTGTEDYYGWAGGVVPDGNDVFSAPFGANVRIGNPANPQGYNICTRDRILDNIPFQNRLVFDMEASPGTDIRNYWNLLAYSTVTFWYGMPGSKSSHKTLTDKAKQDLITLREMNLLQELLKDSTLKFNYRILKQKLQSPVLQTN